MGLTLGCTKEADRAFETKHNCKIVLDITSYKVTIITSNGTRIELHKVPFDCTAAIITTKHCTTQNLLDNIPLIQEYLSLNARINCFGTRLIVGKTETQNFIKELIKLGCKISNVCNGNRNHNPNAYMVAYNICVPNPTINYYISGTAETVTDQTDWMNATTVNEIRKEFGLYIKQGKSL